MKLNSTMKLSCNGCRILRKRCGSDCAIRPCLEWIDSPEYQANATLFLAKFYGRTGLINLITAAPEHLAPEVFRSLLYEACGRTVNPTYGSMGLFCKGEWSLCEAAVQDVLTGSKINNSLVVSDSSNAWRLDADNALPLCDMPHIARVTDTTEIEEITQFNITGSSVIKPQPRLGSVEDSLLSQLHPSKTDETSLDLELSLGFHCQSSEDKTN